MPNGLAALHEVHERPFELLIADFVIPGMDGIELSHQADRINADLKVLFITGLLGPGFAGPCAAPRDAS